MAQESEEEVLDARIAAAEHADLAAKKALDRAEIAEEAAGKRIEESSKQLDRILSGAARHSASKCRPKQKPACCFRWQDHIRDGTQKWNDTIIAWKDAQIRTLQAHNGWRDALDEVQELTGEDERESQARVISILKDMNEINKKTIDQLRVIS